jgi:hypothetical protein
VTIVVMVMMAVMAAARLAYRHRPDQEQEDNQSQGASHDENVHPGVCGPAFAAGEVFRGHLAQPNRDSIHE